MKDPVAPRQKSCIWILRSPQPEWRGLLRQPPDHDCNDSIGLGGMLGVQSAGSLLGLRTIMMYHRDSYLSVY